MKNLPQHRLPSFQRGPERFRRKGGKTSRAFIVLTPFQFWGILALILLFPISMNWKLILQGEVTAGTVVPDRSLPGIIRQQTDIPVMQVVEYEVNGTLYEAAPPENVHYRPGRQIRVLYHPEKPDKYVLLCFSGIFLDLELAWTGLFLLFWLSFFFSFGKIRHRDKQP
ncbi:MAG TPA: hypothetical protein ENN63_10865 [Bacteroidetes bacterium]|nr:hypothetical protein [Bacteroidota bacterium]